MSKTLEDATKELDEAIADLKAIVSKGFGLEDKLDWIVDKLEKIKIAITKPK